MINLRGKFIFFIYFIFLSYSSTLKLWGIISTVFYSLISLSILGYTTYLATGYCAVWTEWKNRLVIVWFLTLLADFLIMEVVFEILILLFFMCRRSGKFPDRMMRFFLAVKNLRNL